MVEENTGVPQQPSGPKSKMSVVLWILGIAIILVVFVIPYALTASPKSCARCHQMEKYYESWQGSVHAKAVSNCFICHVKPGAVSTVMYRFSFYREVYASMTGAELKPSGATLPATENCHRSGCHSLNRISSVSGEIKVDHKNHIKKAKITCIRCHPGVSHPKGDNVIPSRKTCKGCHSQRMDDCAMCHTKKYQAGTKYKH